MGRSVAIQVRCDGVWIEWCDGPWTKGSCRGTGDRSGGVTAVPVGKTYGCSMFLEPGVRDGYG